MVQSAPQLLTVDEFINGYGDSDRYELIYGELIDIPQTPLPKLLLKAATWDQPRNHAEGRGLSVSLIPKSL